MRRPTRRTVGILAAILLLVGGGRVAWTVAGLPPVRHYVRYGLDPYCEPTGETLVVDGVTFVEIGPGVFRMGSEQHAEGGDWLGRLCAPFGLPWGDHPGSSTEMPVHWGAPGEAWREGMEVKRCLPETRFGTQRV